MPRRVSRYWNMNPNAFSARGQAWGNRKTTRLGSFDDGTEELMRHPPGLRGRDIGLFYRDRNRLLKRKKCPKEHILKLSIPKLVVTKIENNLRAIVKLAKEKNIKISANSFTNMYVKEEIDAPVKQEENTERIRNELESPVIVKKEIDEIKEECISSTEDFDFVKPKEPCKKEIDEIKEEYISNTEDFDFVKPKEPCDYGRNVKAGTSSAPDFIPIFSPKIQSGTDLRTPVYIPIQSGNGTDLRTLALRGAGDYKYSYEDIITGTFDQKLEECLSKKAIIHEITNDTIDLSVAMQIDHDNMLRNPQYKRHLEFRKKLPTYTKSQELLDVISSNQVVVISGETGCGKSTQVPQIILDDAIVNKRGANVKILVTQPRRIAAISLARRVANERGEEVGSSIGYAIRLEKVECRDRGSITFCTTGILLVDLEMNQGLTEFSHIILDEVHERDSHIDLAMCMLKKVLRVRKDLKLILMSATIDADKLSAYYDNCPMMHIEGLAYPVKDVYLEEILQMIQYQLPENNKKSKPWHRYKKKGKKEEMGITEKEIRFRAEIGPWLESIKPKWDVSRTLLDPRSEELNIDLIFQLLVHICKEEPGAILVFLPGIGDITKLLREIEQSNAFPKSCFEVYPLHSKLSTIEQHKIFERPPPHVRKIIVATNIAETSITIDDIVYVIDCGKLKYSGLNVEQNISTLQTAWISQANLRQRRGRAGRCQPGICYHLLTSYRAEKLDERILPELQRSNLLEPVLSIKRLRLGMAETALALVPDPPAQTTVQWAVKHLQQCGALDDKETLTPLGWHLARLPVHPAAGKLLLLGSLFGCLDRAASVAAVWGFKDPFLLVIGKEQEVEKAKAKMTLGEPSDHVAMSEAIIQWENQPLTHRRSFAYDNFLSNNTLELLSDMKNQLGDSLKQMGFLTSGDVKSSWENRNSENLSLFKAIVAASLYPNIGTVRWMGLRNAKQNVRIKAWTPEDGKINLHPSSVMYSNPGKGARCRSLMCNKYGANWLVYWLKQRSSNLFLIDVTLVYTLPLLFFGELNIIETVLAEEDSVHMTISKHKVECMRQTADMLIELRRLLDDVLAEKIKVTSDHAVRHSEFEEQVLKTVIELITAEDECIDYFDDDDTTESDVSEHSDVNIMSQSEMATGSMTWF